MQDARPPRQLKATPPAGIGWLTSDSPPGLAGHLPVGFTPEEAWATLEGWVTLGNVHNLSKPPGFILHRYYYMPDMGLSSKDAVV